MEISVIGSSQVKFGRFDFGNKEVGLCVSSNNLNFNVRCKNRLVGKRFVLPTESSIGFRLRASATPQHEVVASEKVSGNRRSKPMFVQIDGVKLYVGLPLDSVSESNTVNHARAIAVGLKALKLLGVEGVELPIWWGVAEKEAMGNYNWTGYLALAEMIEKLGLKLHVSLYFHASKEAKISLPDWVSRIGETRPSIFFTDRSGQQYKDCLSLSVDDLPVLAGKTPIQVYKEFCESFKLAFSTFMGSTITGISIGLGPDGELRYPSHRHPAKDQQHLGAGEFQCYDQNMLSQLKQHAETTGNPLWGLSGPHDVTSYELPPLSSNFVKEQGGSWESPYGDFFLSWYSNQLVAHGDRLLSLASSIFEDASVSISGKIPMVHSWYRTRSHPSELTAGFYNTANRDGYDAIAEIFSKNSCKMVLPGFDLSDELQPNESLSSPESLLKHIISSCRKHAVEILGQNSLESGSPGSFEHIKHNLLDQNGTTNLFTYQRMGAYFFSPEHFPSFTGFMQKLQQAQLHPDDLLQRVEAVSRKDIHVHSA